MSQSSPTIPAPACPLEQSFERDLAGRQWGAPRSALTIAGRKPHHQRAPLEKSEYGNWRVEGASYHDGKHWIVSCRCIVHPTVTREIPETLLRIGNARMCRECSKASARRWNNHGRTR